MATLNFIRGTIRGKIGQFVGSSWRGKGYIKTFTKPGNPRTADQRAVRAVFYNVSHFAKAIYNDVLKKYTFPKPRKQTAYNRMIQLNKALFESKEWEPAGLKIFEGPLENPGITTSVLNAGTVKVSFNPEAGNGQDRAIAFVYNSATGAVVFKTETRAAGFLDVSIAAMENPQSEDLHSYLVFVREPDPEADDIGACSETAYKKIA